MEILIVDRDAALYASSLRSTFEELTIHSASNATEALGCCGSSEVVIALAHAISNQLVARMPNLRWIAALTTGTDHLATLDSLSADVIVTSARGIHGPQMSEMAFLYMIALSRDFARMQANQRKQEWERWPQRLLFGKTAMLVGVGTIGEELALRCKAFGMTTIGVSARSSARGFDTLVPRKQLVAVASRADFLIVLVPYEPATHHLVDASILAAMRPDAILINLARGNVVDEHALIGALEANQIAGAGLDVFATEPLPPSNPLWSMKNVIVTPHVGGMSDVYVAQIMPLLVENMRAFQEGRQSDMRNVVASSI